MKKKYIVLAVLLLSISVTTAQQKKSTASSKKSAAKTHKSSGGGSTSHSPWGIGLRAGTLTGLTVKKYFTKSALEFNLGSIYTYGYNYNKRFKSNYQYVGYGTRRGLGIQVHYMGQKSIKSAAGLDWYYGGGLQTRIDRSYYTYKYQQYYGPGKNDYRWVQITDRPVFVDFGLDGLIGLEYTFKQVPLSVFADATLYIEISHNPGWVNMQGGLGIRYNF